MCSRFGRRRRSRSVRPDMRMFVAVVPPLSALEDLEEFVAPRQSGSAGSGLRWTVPTQWHLTLAFMPDVRERSIDELTERLHRAAARRHAFDLWIGGAGSFPNAARAKVLWAGVDGDLAHLSQLAVGCRAAANKAGAEVEGGPFHPHVTLARIGRPFDVSKWLRVFESYSGPVWHADHIELIHSHLGEGPRGKPRYEVVDEFPLAEPKD